MPESFSNSYEDKQGGVAVEDQEESTEGSIDLEREQALRDFERNREQAFSHAFAFDEDIRNLEAEVAAYEDGMDKDPEMKKRYEEQVHFLERQREKQQAVAMYERKLWGSSPEEHLEGKGKLLEDIALIKDPVDVLALFDRWGALPGANTVDRPVINRDSVASFLSKIQEQSDVPQALIERAQKLFPNKRLREKVLQFTKQRDHEVEARISEPEVPFRELSPDVWDEEDEETPLPSQEEVERAKKIRAWEENQIISETAEKPVDSYTEVPVKTERLVAKVIDTEKEIRELKDREQSLLEAQSIIESPLFKYTPFLMRFTKKGREDLAKVKNAGFTLSTTGASPETLEMARALKLKSIRERLAQLNGSTQAFAHNLSSREKSVKKAVEQDYSNPLPDVRGERDRDTAMLSRAEGTKRENVRRVAKIIAPEYSVSRVDPERKTHYVEDDKKVLSTDHTMTLNRFSAPIARRSRRIKSGGETVVLAEEVPSRAELQEETVIREADPIVESAVRNEVITNRAESQEEKVTREALAVFNRKKAQKEALVKKVAEVTGKVGLSKKEVRAEAVKMKRKKKQEEKTNN